MKKLIFSIGSIYVALFFLYACQHEEIIAPDEQLKSNSSAQVLIKASVLLKIGGIPYENIEAHVVVRGFDKTNEEQWSKEYRYIGPLDTLSVQNGFDHYSIELKNKWGITDAQSEISKETLWDGRADGPNPVTYTLGGAIEARKLSMYTVSRQVKIAGANVFPPESRVKYSYDGEGHLKTIHYENYNTLTSQFEETMTDTFVYDGATVSRITRALYDKPYSEYQYGYGISTKISEKLLSDNKISWTQTFTSSADKANVTWSFYNGSSFLYSFDILYNNIASDETIKAGQLCNEGAYTYDKNINPFRHLGYIDFALQNWSASNKVVEDIDYKACSFPANRVPVSYRYSYNPDGYPVKKVATYKSGNSDDLYYSETDFIYNP